MTDQDVSLVCICFFSLLCNQQQLVKQKKGPFIFGSLQTKRSFKNQLPVSNQIGPFPVGQKTLDFLHNDIKKEELVNPSLIEDKKSKNEM